MKIFKTILASKAASLLLLSVSLLGVKGKKDEKIEKRTAIVYILTGLILFFISQSMLLMQFSVSIKSGAYIGVTSLGYFLILTGGTLLSRLIKLSLQGDIFNKLNGIARVLLQIH